MVYINEFLPNPAGADAGGEWVELWNAGPAAVNLAGWRIGAGGAVKPKALPAKTIPAGEYLVLHRKETKLALKNTDGEIVLYDAAEQAAARLSFRGTAPEGKSVNRLAAPEGIGYFAAPSPGAANTARASLASMADDYPRGVPIAGGSAAGDVFALWIGSAALIAAAAFLMVKWSSEITDLSELFFPRY